MPKNQHLEIDWSAVRAELDGIRASIVPFKIASESEVRTCKLSDMTYGMIRSNLIEDWKRGECIVVFDREKRERLIDLAYILGFCDDGSFTNDEYKGKNRPRWERLDELLARRAITTDFLFLWALLNFNFGVYVELYLGNETAYKREFHQCMMAIADATEIQRHWYAHWMHEALKTSRDIDDARSELIGVIESIAARRLKPWGPYKVEWYECMLERQKGSVSQTGKYSGDLKTSYTKITKAEIKRMVQDPQITRRVLPPLSADGFERA